jgi:hypothetical protein
MSVEDHTANDCAQRSSLERSAREMVGSLHEQARDSNQMHQNKSNREGDGEK